MASLIAIVPLPPARATCGEGLLADLGGRPLLFWTLAAAAESGATTRVVVVGPGGPTLDWARRWGAETVAVTGRPGRRTPEHAALRAFDALASPTPLPPLVALLSPDLPLRRPGRLDEALAALAVAGAESLMAVCEEAPRFWCPSPGGLIPLYDHQDRDAPPAREPWLRESGSLYLAGCEGLARHRQRLFGRIATLETDWTEAIRADDPAGLAVCRALLGHVRPGEAAPPAVDPGSAAASAG